MIFNNVAHIFHRVVVSLLLFLSLNVNAAEEISSLKPKSFSTSAIQSAGTATDSVNTGHLGQLVVGLVIVLLCIVALAWIAKRFNRLQSTPDGSLQVLGGMSMGARERIVLVQVGARQLLLGVAPGRINTLHVLDEPLEAVSNITDQLPGKGFAEKLTAALSRNQK